MSTLLSLSLLAHGVSLCASSYTQDTIYIHDLRRILAHIIWSSGTGNTLAVWMPAHHHGRQPLTKPLTDHHPHEPDPWQANGRNVKRTNNSSWVAAGSSDSWSQQRRTHRWIRRNSSTENAWQLQWQVRQRPYPLCLNVNFQPENGTGPPPSPGP